jgi:hypothetical protein
MLPTNFDLHDHRVIAFPLPLFDIGLVESRASTFDQSDERRQWKSDENREQFPIVFSELYIPGVVTHISS